ncbi:MAG: TVP38/TMEM64 family protein [Gemmatimonadota bacterium]
MLHGKLKGLLLVFLAGALVLLLGRRAAAYVPVFVSWVDSLGTLGPAVSMAGYVLATVAMVPGSILTLAGGALFGLARGIIYVFFAASIGATLAFLIARYIARGAVVRRLGPDARFRALDTAIEREGRKIFFLIRLSPLFPFNVTNYAAGVTSLRLRDYLIACLGMLPGTILWVYYGHLIGNVASLVAGAPAARGYAHWILLGVGLLATVAATTLVTRAARRALNSSVQDTRANGA